MVSHTEIEKARDRISAHLIPTPLVACEWLSQRLGRKVLCKLENLQRTGSFKFRGAFNELLQLEAAKTDRQVVTASAGNHGLGVAEACRILGRQATVFVPVNASPLKVGKLQHLGATVIQQGADYDDAHAAAERFASETRLPFIHAFAQEGVIAGQGTVGLELVRDLPDPPGAVLVPVGGGGLIGGMAVAIKSRWPKTAIIGIQSSASPAMARALTAGSPVETPIEPTIADGLAGRWVATETLHLVQHFVDEMVLVSEDSIRQAMREFYCRQGWRLEASAVVGCAAVLEGQIRIPGPLVLVITGGNISEDDFGRHSEL